MTSTFEILQDENSEIFLREAGPLLYRDEAVNNLLIGLCEAMGTPNASSGAAPRLFRIRQGNETVSAAIQTPPLNLILSPCPDAALVTLADFLDQVGLRFPGVVGPAREAESFARLWSERSGQRLSLGMAQKIYRLDEVVPPAATPGLARPAHASEQSLIERWIFEFVAECLPISDRRSPDFWKAYAARAVENQSAFVWDLKGEAVAMAHAARPTRNGTTVNAVYTPQPFRQKGYASALVAALSQRILDSGKTFCVLYTDLANPTSNKIYQRIGYRELIESRHFVFE